MAPDRAPVSCASAPAMREVLPVDDHEATLETLTVDSDPFAFRARAHEMWTGLSTTTSPISPRGGSTALNSLLAESARGGDAT